MPKQTEIPPVEKLKLKDLTQDLRYSGRTEREINENAKDKAKELAAAGGWSPAMPGQYFIGEDGAKMLLAGFSRVRGCEINGDKEGYFVKVDGDEVDHLLACETTNSVRPLSMLARGLRYAELLKGAVADDFAGTIAKDPADFKRQPLTMEQISERIGRSREWVRKCVAVAEAPEAIREMIENDQIAATVFDGAKVFSNKHYDGAENKIVAMCKRAYKYCLEDGKAEATKQHFDAIKEEFLPPKKLIAEDTENKSGDTEPVTDASNKKNRRAEEPLPDALPVVPGESAADLFSDTPDVLGGKGDKLKEEMGEYLLNPDNVEEITLDPDTVKTIVEGLLVIVARHREVF